jgi:Smg protein
MRSALILRTSISWVVGTGSEPQTVSSMMLILELEGHVQAAPGAASPESVGAEVKDNVLDLLIYLFENYMSADDEPRPDRDTLKIELDKAGFAERDIDRALQWLDGLSGDQLGKVAEATARAVRVFSSQEVVRLDTDVRGYLMYLENVKILSAAERELVIDRLMALEADEIDIEQVKWVVLMVLFSQPGQESAYAQMEDLVFEERSDALH